MKKEFRWTSEITGKEKDFDKLQDCIDDAFDYTSEHFTDTLTIEQASPNRIEIGLVTNHRFIPEEHIKAITNFINKESIIEKSKETLINEIMEDLDANRYDSEELIMSLVRDGLEARTEEEIREFYHIPK